MWHNNSFHTRHLSLPSVDIAFRHLLENASFLNLENENKHTLYCVASD